MINEVALVLLFGLFGWKTALIYMSTGLLIAITSGFVIGKLKLEKSEELSDTRREGVFEKLRYLFVWEKNLQ